MPKRRGKTLDRNAIKIHLIRKYWYYPLQIPLQPYLNMTGITINDSKSDLFVGKFDRNRGLCFRIIAQDKHLAEFTALFLQLDDVLHMCLYAKQI